MINVIEFVVRNVVYEVHGMLGERKRERMGREGREEERERERTFHHLDVTL